MRAAVEDVDLLGASAQCGPRGVHGGESAADYGNGFADRHVAAGGDAFEVVQCGHTAVGGLAGQVQRDRRLGADAQEDRRVAGFLELARRDVLAQLFAGLEINAH